MKIKLLLVGCVLGLVAGCKVAVILVEGGEVQSTASGTCMIDTLGEGKVCIHEVSSTSYSESFTAVPDAGGRFVKWNSGGGFFCADATHPTCVVSNVLLAGNPIGEAVVASEQTFYIMPVFEGGIGSVIVDGKEWAQVDLFNNLSWNDINAVCLGGVCSGLLNSYDMTGWTWASRADLSELFNYYGVTPPLSPTDQSTRYEESSSWGLAFFADGWRPLAPTTGGSSDPTSCTDLCVTGWLSDAPYIESYGGTDTYMARIYRNLELSDGLYVRRIGFSASLRVETIGGWFYRTP